MGFKIDLETSGNVHLPQGKASPGESTQTSDWFLRDQEPEESKFVRIREYEPKDAGAVVQLAEKYASWDATPTLADIQGFHARNPDLFFIAELGDEIVGFV